MIPLSLPAPSGASPKRFRLLVMAMFVLGVAHVVERAAYWSGHWDTRGAWGRSAGLVAFTIGSTSFRIPAGYLVASRYGARADNGDRHAIVKLSMSWPALSPGTGADRLGTLDIPERTIFAELEFSPGRESMRARLDPFYRRLARAGEQVGPAGLRFLSLSAPGAVASDLIAYDPSRRNGFIARCRKNRSSRNAICFRAVVLTAGVELRYRFSQGLLADWRRIENAMLHKIMMFREL